MQCRSHAAQLGKLYSKFQEQNFEVLLILGELVDKARQYAENLHLPFPVLADPNREIYQKYALHKTLYIQRTASVIIDCDGIIRYFKAVINPFSWLQESRAVLEFVNSMAVVC